MGIRESLGKIKDKVLNAGRSQSGNDNGKRTMTENEVKKKESYSTKNIPEKVRSGRIQTKSKPKKSRLSGAKEWLEKRAEEERANKERRDERKRKLEVIESKAFTKGVEDYYRSKGRRGGYAAAKARSGDIGIPILGEPGKIAKRMQKNFNANPLMVGTFGKQNIRGQKTSKKSNKRRTPTVNIVIQKDGKVTQSSRRKKKRKRDSDEDRIRDLIGF